MSKLFAATTTFSFFIANCNQIGFLLSMERCTIPRQCLENWAPACAGAGEYWFSGRYPKLCREIQIQILPFWVGRLNQIHLPIAIPLLDLSFAGSSRNDTFVYFKPNQLIDLVLSGKSGNDFRFVFPDPFKQIICVTHIQRSVPITCHDVNRAWHVFFATHAQLSNRVDGQSASFHPIRIGQFAKHPA